MLLVIILIKYSWNNSTYRSVRPGKRAWTSSWDSQNRPPFWNENWKSNKKFKTDFKETKFIQGISPNSSSTRTEKNVKCVGKETEKNCQNFMNLKGFRCGTHSEIFAKCLRWKCSVLFFMGKKVLGGKVRKHKTQILSFVTTRNFVVVVFPHSPPSLYSWSCSNEGQYLETYLALYSSKILLKFLIWSRSKFQTDLLRCFVSVTPWSMLCLSPMSVVSLPSAA